MAVVAVVDAAVSAAASVSATVADDCYYYLKSLTTEKTQNIDPLVSFSSHPIHPPYDFPPLPIF